MENNINRKTRQEGRIFAGLILVCVGAALLLRNSGFPLPYWLFSWPVILILVGLYTGIKHNFKNTSWIILMAIGGFFLVDQFIPDIRLAPYFWPVAIIALGVLFILRPDRSKWRSLREDEKKNTFDSSIAGNNFKDTTAEPSSFTTDTSDELRVSSVFSGIERSVVSKNFQGGKISCVFGGADIDLTQADLQGKKLIKFEVVFGGAKLIVPPHWTVYNEIEGVFHSVEDKRKFNAAAVINPDKILVLKGSVVFGGVEIRSY